MNLTLRYCYLSSHSTRWSLLLLETINDTANIHEYDEEDKFTEVSQLLNTYYIILYSKSVRISIMIDVAEDDI